MKRVLDGYFCAQCDRNVPVEHVRSLGHSIGNVHDGPQHCMSGRVTPIWREDKEKD